MASTATVRTGAARLDLRIETEGFADAVRGLRDVRNQIARRIDELAQEAGENVVLPDAKRRASHLKVDGRDVSASLVVRKRRTAPYLTTTIRGIRGRAVGLQEMGGTVRTVIEPRKRRALAFGGGHPVARVSTAREYRAQRFMQGAVEARIDEYGQELRDLIVTRIFSDHFQIR